MKQSFVYIMSNKNRSAFYIGVTNSIEQRVKQHKDGTGSTFTTKYNCHFLMYFEEFADIVQAIAREKQLKNWHRDWKINLIKESNPKMVDLAEGWYE